MAYHSAGKPTWARTFERRAAHIASVEDRSAATEARYGRRTSIPWKEIATAYPPQNNRITICTALLNCDILTVIPRAIISNKKTNIGVNMLKRSAFSLIFVILVTLISNSSTQPQVALAASTPLPGNRFVGILYETWYNAYDHNYI